MGATRKRCYTRLAMLHACQASSVHTLRCARAGVLSVVACMRPEQTLHVYGFNWSPESYFMHKMSAEQQIIAKLLKVRPCCMHPSWACRVLQCAA